MPADTRNVLEYWRTIRYVLLFLVLFSGCNHAVRAASMNPSSSAGLIDWGLSSRAPIIRNLNSTRVEVGRVIYSGANYCGTGISPYCRKFFHGVRLVTGTF